MLTKQDCINVSKAIADACAFEKKNFHWQNDHKYALNGMMIRALGNLWHNVFTSKQREYFGYDYEKFSKSVVDFNA